MKRTLPVLFSLIALPAFAEGTRELDSHEHGVGELNIAIEGKTIAMELHAPGADIVGFEYAAKSDEDRAAIENAVAALAKPLALFAIPNAASCTVTQASASLESEDEHEEHGDHDDHDDEHEDHGDEHAEHADEDGHDEHAEESSHTEFHAEYVLSCENPEAITEINFTYFDTFPNALELEVQIVSASGAKAFEVERDTPILDLRGMF